MPAIASYEKEYVSRTRRSKAHFERANKVLPAGVESNVRFFPPYPFCVKRAKGPYLYDIDGNKIIDYALGYGPMILGHDHPAVTRAVRAQVGNGMMFGASSELAVEYIDMVRRAMPSIEMFRFANSGTEATMHPMRVARAFTGKEKIAKAEGAYHGGHDYALQGVDIPSSELRPNTRQHSVPFGKGIPKCISDLMVMYPFNDWGATEEVITRNADELAAVIIEPVQAGRRMLRAEGRLPQEAAGGSRRTSGSCSSSTRSSRGSGSPSGVPRSGTVSSRTSPASQRSPAAATSSPGSAAGGRSWRRSSRRRTVTSTTGARTTRTRCRSTGGLATLKILSRPGTYRRIDTIGDSLFHGLRDAAEDSGIDVWVESVGSLGQMYFTDKEVATWRDSLDVDHEKWRHWFMHSLGRGVFFGVPHADEHFFTSLAHSDDRHPAVDRDLGRGLQGDREGPMTPRVPRHRRNKETRKAPSVS